MDNIFFIIAAFGFLYLVILIIYYVFLVRAILQMLRGGADTVLKVFAFIALLPFPFTVVMGIILMIIWVIHRKTLSEK